SVSSSFPAAPTNGSPCRSSLKPGASPTIMMSAGQGPTPGTACVRVAWSPHFTQARISVWSCSSSKALGDFHPRLERDEVSRISDRLHHGFELVGGERNQRQAKRTGCEAHRVDGGFDRPRVGRGGQEGLDPRHRPRGKTTSR